MRAEVIAISDPSVKMLINPIHLLALGIGSGLSPKAPGTAGSLLALVLFAFLASWLQPYFLWIALVASLVGIPICAYTSNAIGGHDHGAIVWDEFAGMWLALALLPLDWAWWFAAFVLFRLLDIRKPWPISWADKSLVGGLGIMLDDILAGVFTAIILLAVQFFFF